MTCGAAGTCCVICLGMCYEEPVCVIGVGGMIGVGDMWERGECVEIRVHDNQVRGKMKRVKSGV